MFFQRLGTLLASVGIVLSACAAADAPAAEPDRDALQATVVASVEKYEKAFSARDAKALVALFTADAEYVDAEGTVFHGQSAIEGEMLANFQVSPPGKIDIQVSSIRPISDGVLVEEGTSLFLPKDQGQPSATRYVAMHVRQQDGTWLIASVRELAQALTRHERLMTLSWLIGSWREEVDRQVVETTWKWSEDGNFLVADFVHRRSNEILLKGTHRVGWDAARKQFHSWVFDSSGGAVQGWWTSEGGAWTVDLTGTDVDGGPLGTSLTYQRDGANAILVTQTRRVRGQLALPDDSHRIVRQPPAPGPAPAPTVGVEGARR